MHFWVGVHSVLVVDARTVGVLVQALLELHVRRINLIHLAVELADRVAQITPGGVGALTRKLFSRGGGSVSLAEVTGAGPEV